MEKSYNKTLDNTKREFTEADMFIFALDYMERFQFELMDKGSIPVKKADRFLSKNINKFRPVNP